MICAINHFLDWHALQLLCQLASTLTQISTYTLIERCLSAMGVPAPPPRMQALSKAEWTVAAKAWQEIFWVIHQNPSSPTMAQPSQCRLSYAFSGDIDEVFPIGFTLNVDTVDNVKKKKKKAKWMRHARLLTGLCLRKV